MRRAGLLLAVGLAACAPNVAGQVAKAPEFDTPGQAKCGVAKSQSEPLVVEWPSAARAKLEALSRTGVVAVRYTGCEMEILASCSAPGKYGYTAITPKRDKLVIRNEDDLYANIPLGAARLEGKLERSGELDVDMSIVGRYASDRAAVRPDELQGPDCAKATHVVSALTVGAFDFSAGAGAEVGGAAGVGSAGGGAKSTSSRELLNSDGKMASCEDAKTSDSRPPDGCGAILRLEVTPLGQPKPETPASAPPPQTGAAGSGGLGLAGVGAGGEIELTVPEKDMSFEAVVEAGGKPYACEQPVTYYKPCHLSGLPEGKAVVRVTGTAAFQRDIPISADGRTSVQLQHRGPGLEIAGGVLTGLGGAGLAFGLMNGEGLSGNQSNENNIVWNIVAVTVGGTFLLIGLPSFVGWMLADHDGVIIESPGHPAEFARGPHLEWGGPLAPTTIRF